MIESLPRLSAPGRDHARETYVHCIQYLLLQWFNPPIAVPEQEAVGVRSEIQRVIRLLLDEMELSMPGSRDSLLHEMRGLADLMSTPPSGV